VIEAPPSPALRIFAFDPATGLEAFVAVDSLVGGRALGGTRMTGDVTIGEVAGLARIMALKLALVGLPIGGAKAGIRSVLGRGRLRDDLLTAFGRAIRPLLLGGVYLGSDQGVSFRDRDVFLAAAGLEVALQPGVSRLPCTWAHLWERCRDVTGFGVCEAIDAALEATGRDPRRLAVSVQGFGAVGQPVAEGLARRGARIVAVADRHGTIYRADGLRVDELRQATDSAGTIDRSLLRDDVQRFGAPDAWLLAGADLVVAAAGGGAITASNAHRVTASLVVEAGNLSCSPAAQRALAARGIPVLPGIVVNSGGAAMTGLVLIDAVPAGLSTDDLLAWAYGEIGGLIARNVVELFERRTSDPRSLLDLALELTKERRGTPTGRLPARVANAP
jgi:glutamate dehydrogenase (NAD(P)+)